MAGSGAEDEEMAFVADHVSDDFEAGQGPSPSGGPERRAGNGSRAQHQGVRAWLSPKNIACFAMGILLGGLVMSAGGDASTGVVGAAGGPIVATGPVVDSVPSKGEGVGGAPSSTPSPTARAPSPAKDGSGWAPPVDEPTDQERAAQWARAKETLRKMRIEIEAAYGLTATDVAKSMWEGTGAREHLVKRLQSALATQGGSFTVAFTGMSVCAGHGSYFNESYPIVFRNVMKRAFDAAGVRFEVRNQCMGGTYTFPYAWCVANIAGDDVDVVAWDFGMMEAGRSYHSEGFIQQAARIDTRPVVLFMGGYGNKLLTETSGGALTDIKGYPVDGYRLGLAKFYAAKGYPVTGFWAAPALGEKYTQIQIPESQRGRGRWENFIDLKPKNPSSSTPPALRDLRWYSRKGLPGMASWHPAPREHNITARLLAHSYMGLLSEALDREIGRLARSPPPEPPNLSQLIEGIAVPHPRECNRHPELFCGNGWQCATSYEPRVGRGLEDLVENDNYKQALAPADNTAVAEVVRLGVGYLDRKYAYRGRRVDGPASFRLHHVKDGKVIVCEPTYGWRRPNTVLDIHKDVEFYIDGKKIANPGKMKIKSAASNCVLVTDSCPAGGHHLSVLPLVEHKYLYVSFVLWS